MPGSESEFQEATGKLSQHWFDNKFFVKIQAQILGATEATAFPVSVVKSSPSELELGLVEEAEQMQPTYRKDVSETAAAGYLLAWNVTCLAGSPSKCTRPVIREWNRPNNVRDLHRADEQIQINAAAKVSCRKVASLVPSQCLGNIQPSAVFKTPVLSCSHY